jgi:hypothetical protein
MRHSALSIVVLTGAVALGAAACDRDTSAREPAPDAGATASEAARDTGAAVAGATETVDVKAALMRDDGVDASEINVDTDGSRKVVVLKGSVSTDAQRTRAAEIAEREAEGYRVDNQLVVRAR